MGRIKTAKTDLVELRDIVLDNFETDFVDINHADLSLEIAFENADYLENEEGVVELTRIKIQYVGWNTNRSKKGIHMFLDKDGPDLEYRIVGLIEESLKNGYSMIYIHSEDYVDQLQGETK